MSAADVSVRLGFPSAALACDLDVSRAEPGRTTAVGLLVSSALMGQPWAAGVLMRSSFTYMTSNSRLFVPFLFNFCSSVMNINGRAGRPWPSALRPRTSEVKLSLDAERAHPPFGDRRAGKRARAVTALTSTALTSTALTSAAAVIRRHLVRCPGGQD